MLTESGSGEPAELERAADQASGPGLFIRSLVGLDRDAATEALSDFIAKRTLTANQLHFINLIVTYLTEHGVMDIARLYEAPFTDHAPSGPEALFSGADIDDLVAVLHGVRATASSGVA
jgi:type I restriction enzyme R subunit